MKEILCCLVRFFLLLTGCPHCLNALTYDRRFGPLASLPATQQLHKLLQLMVLPVFYLCPGWKHLWSSRSGELVS